MYQIEQSIVIGKGKYNPSDPEGIAGGTSLFYKPIELKNDRWYTINVKLENNVLTFTVNNQTSAKYNITKKNLSTKGNLGFITNGTIQIRNFKIEALLPN